jgi:hypothetical protein
MKLFFTFVKIADVMRPAMIIVLYGLVASLSAQGLNPLAEKALTKEKNTSPTKSEEKPHILAPFKWGVNDEYSLQLGGDTRMRFEDRRNFDMNQKKVNDNDQLGFVRTRLNAELKYENSFRTFVEILDGREVDSREDQLQEAHFDLHQAFLEYSQPKVSPWGVRIGRQELLLGKDRRLNQSTNWNNLRRHFDGVDVLYRSEDLDGDFFIMKPSSYEQPRGAIAVSGRSVHRPHEWYYGGFMTLKKYKPHTIEAYFLGLSDMDHHRDFPRPVRSEDGEFGSTDRYTIGSAVYGELWKEKGVGTMRYNTDAAFQFGHRSNDAIKAWMLHGDLAYEMDRPWKPTFGLVGNIASGDKRSGDGETNTFNPLYGRAHGPYGLIDFTRLQNLRELAITGSVEPTEKLKVQVELHSFWLDSKTDAWVDTRGESLGRDNTGKSGRHIGNEIDAFATYKFNKYVSVEAGAAHFLDEGFARNVGRHSDANLFYLQTVISF